MSTSIESPVVPKYLFGDAKTTAAIAALGTNPFQQGDIVTISANYGPANTGVVEVASRDCPWSLIGVKFENGDVLYYSPNDLSKAGITA